MRLDFEGRLPSLCERRGILEAGRWDDLVAETEPLRYSCHAFLASLFGFENSCSLIHFVPFILLPLLLGWSSSSTYTGSLLWINSENGVGTGLEAV